MGLERLMQAGVLCAAVGLLLVVYSTRTPDVLMAQVGESGNDVARMRSQIRSLDSRLSPMLGKLNDMRQEEESLRDKASKLEANESKMRSMVHSARAAVERLRFKVHQLQSQQLTESLLPPLPGEQPSHAPKAHTNEYTRVGGSTAVAHSVNKSPKEIKPVVNKARVSALQQVPLKRSLPQLASRVVSKYAKEYATQEEKEMAQYNAEKKAFEKQQQAYVKSELEYRKQRAEAMLRQSAAIQRSLFNKH